MLEVIKEKDALLFPVANALPRWVTPNMLTYVRFFFIPLVVALVLAGQPVLAVVAIAFGFFLDVLDGTLARARNQKTDFGAIMDPMADKGLFLVALIMLGINTLPFILICALIVLETVILIGSLYFAIIFRIVGVNRELGANIYGKIKAIFQVVALILLGFGQFSPKIIAAATILLWFSLLVHLVSMGKHILFEKNSDAH